MLHGVDTEERSAAQSPADKRSDASAALPQGPEVSRGLPDPQLTFLDGLCKS